MTRQGAEGLAAVDRMSPAAKEEFTGTVNGPDRLARPQSGWDPYEVWRTRVKAAFTVRQERGPGPLRHHLSYGGAPNNSKAIR
jgi:hypothetical protein